MGTYELQFRNINATPDDPVDVWGFEGYLAAIERGDFKHWCRMREFARRNPWSDEVECMLEAAACADDAGVGAVEFVRLSVQRARSGAWRGGSASSIAGKR